jgi:hypothetical protein
MWFGNASHGIDRYVAFRFEPFEEAGQVSPGSNDGGWTTMFRQSAKVILDVMTSDL